MLQGHQSLASALQPMDLTSGTLPAHTLTHKLLKRLKGCKKRIIFNSMSWTNKEFLNEGSCDLALNEGCLHDLQVFHLPSSLSSKLTLCDPAKRQKRQTTSIHFDRSAGATPRRCCPLGSGESTPRWAELRPS